MTMLTRRSTLAGLVGASVLMPSCSPEQVTLTGVSYDVRMITTHPEDRRKMNVFDPGILKVNPGDVVKFIPDIPDHSAESTPGMIPKKAKSWRGVFGGDVSVTFTIPGIYGYHCLAHGVIGMVGLIIVTGEGMTHNLAAAKKIKHSFLAQRAWDKIWEEVEARDLLRA